MKNVRTLSLLFLLSFALACSENKTGTLDFLVGTWAVAGKSQYEVWEKGPNNELRGYAYTFDNDRKIILETLSIKEKDGQIIYEATVPDQNEGKTIQFILNPEIKSHFSFENEQHDFPKKIQYRKISDNKIQVSVSGEKDKGFSYIQIRD